MEQDNIGREGLHEEAQKPLNRIKTILIGFDGSEGCNVVVVVSHPTELDFEEDTERFIEATGLQDDTVYGLSVGPFDDALVDCYHSQDGTIPVRFLDLDA